jgi:hypothetical protein
MEYGLNGGAKMEGETKWKKRQNEGDVKFRIRKCCSQFSYNGKGIDCGSKLK